MKLQRNQFRIIAGHWRGRVLNFPDGEGLRPTGDRIRETLFNWLQVDIVNAVCLDAYAGSGALGFEALSRGAASVLSLDTAPEANRQLQHNSELLQTSRLQVRQVSALDWLQHNPSGQHFDLIFLDPPFEQSLLQQSCSLIEDRGWLSPGGKVYLESASPLEALILPTGWKLLRSKKAGQVYYGLSAKIT